MTQAVVKSHLEGINDLIGGHLLRLPTLVYGAPASGKSIMTDQMAWDFLVSGENVLFVDTEGGLDRLLSLWKTVFDKRFSIETKLVAGLDGIVPGGKSVIYVLEGRHIKTILALHGWKSELEISKGGDEGVPKINFRFAGVTDNVVKKLVKAANIKYLVYDSLSAPIKTAFVGGRTQFPARADATNLWLGAISEIADDFDIAIWATNHQSVDPTNPYAKPHKRGGPTLEYVFKASLYMQASKSNRVEKKGHRKLWIERFLNKEPWQEFAEFRLTNELGYIDSQKTGEEKEKEA